MRDSAAVLPPTVPFVAETLLAPQQAVIAFLARVVALEPVAEYVSLDAAAGRVLAQDAVAHHDYPSHRRSSMDGFAIDTRAGSVPRRIVGEVLMGSPPPRAISGDEALRIPTGGALPDGADAVVPLEDVDEDGMTIVLKGAVPPPGDAFTPIASDIRRGEGVLARGRRIGAPELGVLATLGFAAVPVYRSPVFGIISTGDELVEPAEQPRIGQIRDSNRYAVAGALRAMGVTPLQLPRAADTADALRAAMAEGLKHCDGLVLTGGSSVGARDLVPRVIGSLGEPGAVVHGIRVKPGKPTMLGAVGGHPIIGLPGNPASALMILEAVVRPIIAAWTGERLGHPLVLTAVAQEALLGREGWTWYVPVTLHAAGERLGARPLKIQSSHTSLLARASGYAVLAETRWRVEPGEEVAIQRFSSGGAPVE